MKTWECKECGKEVVSKTKPKSACSCGAHAWKPLGGKAGTGLTGFNQTKLILDAVARQLRGEIQHTVVAMKRNTTPTYFRLNGELAAYKHALAIVQAAKRGIKNG